MKINIPQIIEAQDYHDFSVMSDCLKTIIPSIKVKELGFNGDYLGIAYAGKLTDPKNRKIIKEIKRLSEEFDKELRDE